jgi:hypothetical protein
VAHDDRCTVRRLSGGYLRHAPRSAGASAARTRSWVELVVVVRSVVVNVEGRGTPTHDRAASYPGAGSAGQDRAGRARSGLRGPGAGRSGAGGGPGDHPAQPCRNPVAAGAPRCHHPWTASPERGLPSGPAPGEGLPVTRRHATPPSRRTTEHPATPAIRTSPIQPGRGRPGDTANTVSTGNGGRRSSWWPSCTLRSR